MSRGLSDRILRGEQTLDRPPPPALYETALMQMKQRLRSAYQREQLLRQALREWGWHLDSCAIQDDDGAGCDCGWSHLFRWFGSGTGKQSRDHFRLLRGVALKQMREYSAHSKGKGAAGELRRMRAEHELLVCWLHELGRPMDAGTREALRRVGAQAKPSDEAYIATLTQIHAEHPGVPEHQVKIGPQSKQAKDVA